MKTRVTSMKNDASIAAYDHCPDCGFIKEHNPDCLWLANRARIIDDIEDCSCQRCGKSALIDADGRGIDPIDVAKDTGWFIDSELTESGEVASLFCPNCW